MLIAFNKPFRMLSQFTDDAGRRTLADAIRLPKVRPAGRLDYDSEGLLLLTDVGTLQERIADPRHKLAKTYWVQVEGRPDAAALEKLRRGVQLRDGQTRPAQVRLLPEPELWERDPPIRFRRNIPTTWIELVIREGRNRQVRRMTAAVGFPTLRLVRVAIGPFHLNGLAPGEWREVAIPPSLAHHPRLDPIGEADSGLLESPHDLETQRRRGSDRRAQRPLPSGRGGSRRTRRTQPTRRPPR